MLIPPCLDPPVFATAVALFRQTRLVREPSSIKLPRWKWCCDRVASKKAKLYRSPQKIAVLPLREKFQHVVTLQQPKTARKHLVQTLIDCHIQADISAGNNP
ncbi:hypothetical protein N7G274_001600 [Stereocaulon virgatum]|uniref:Uncharacterized protein n=1 Tax=Stereocaulon virgatum TaxID=373712 RepID=A0ABR4AK52_9LECA